MPSISKYNKGSSQPETDKDCRLEVIVPRLFLVSGEAKRGDIVKGSDIRINVADALRFKLVKVFEG